MGFLSGAYGKLMAGKMVRSIQYEMTRVQSQLRRVTRELDNAEKMFNAQERNIKTQMQAQMQQSVFQYGAGLGMNLGDPNSLVGMDSAIMQKYSAFQQYQQYQYTMAMNSWQNTFEMQRDMVLEQLQAEQEDLETQKDNLESRLQVAQADYDAKKKEEQAGAKNIAPDYTGQGG